jgi:hypothetical protein
MPRQNGHPQHVRSLSRRDLLKNGLAAGVALSAWPLFSPPALWGGETGQPKRGGILRVRGRDPVHFDPDLTINHYTNYVLSFTHSRAAARWLDRSGEQPVWAGVGPLHHMAQESTANTGVSMGIRL